MNDLPLAVFPLRFTADAPALRRFLEVLGMAPVVTTEDDGFADMAAGGGGRVMVHSAAGSATGAPAGETQLSLITPCADATAEQLRRAGLEVEVRDESYGRQGNITGPHREAVGVNEEQHDTYGYAAHDGSGADPRLSVVAVRPSAAGAERERDVEFFGVLGFRPVGPADEHWLQLRRPGGGSIGLHAPAPGESPAREGDVGGQDLRVSLVRLGFETTEDLGELAARLARAGYADARAVLTGPAPAVHVTDPDGCQVEIHPRPED